MKYDELAKELREIADMTNWEAMINEAADAITTLQAELELYKAECSELRANGFENAQDLWTSYVGLKAELEKSKQDYKELISTIGAFAMREIDAMAAIDKAMESV